MGTKERQAVLHRGDVLDVYGEWDIPQTIISDGAYGVGGFPGDPRQPDGLAEWYRPHVEQWSKHASVATTLWFWNTEVGWANVHPLLVGNGWEYEQTVTWDKGISHIAGNVNGQTIRRFPVVTEVCVLYSRKLTLPTQDGVLDAQAWMRYEWQRSGLPMYRANEAVGVKNAASRKYLAADWLWYFPPPDAIEKMAAYANAHGVATDRPYFSIDGETSVTAAEWAELRYSWNHKHGLTNVWSCPPLNGRERLRGTGKRIAPRVHNPGKNATAHLNQKPLELMSRLVESVTKEGDVVWEPFGGLCTASIAATSARRRSFAAEIFPHFADIAAERLFELDAQQTFDIEQAS